MTTKIKVQEEITVGALLRKIMKKHAGGEPKVTAYNYYDRPETTDVSDAVYEKVAEEFREHLLSQR